MRTNGQPRCTVTVVTLLRLLMVDDHAMLTEALSVRLAEHPDLLVVGSRGLNSLKGRILGSVPSEVARRADCDVLVVRTTR